MKRMKKNVKKLYLKILKLLYNKIYKLYKYITTMIQTSFTPQSNSSMEPTGTWVNTKTGETITIKTMVNDMSGDGSQLMLTDGRLMSFAEFSNDYVQMEEDSTNPQNDMILDTTSKTPQLNIDLLTSGLGNNNNNNKNNNKNNINSNKLESYDSPYETPFDNMDEIDTRITQKRINLDKINLNSNSLNGYTKQQNIVKEFLDNLKKQPTINFKSVYIDNMPTEPISTFVKYLGVTKEDIVDVLYNELFKDYEIKSILNDYVTGILNDDKNTSQSASRMNGKKPVNKIK